MLNLSSLTLSMNSVHCCCIVWLVTMVNSLNLIDTMPSLLSYRMLFMHLTLSCNNCLSALFNIFIAPTLKLFIKNLCIIILVKPKDKDPKEKKSGVIYCYQCTAIACGEEYISETSRALGERYKEHLREPSPIQVHSNLTGHQLSQDNFSIIDREGQDITRLIKESIFIRVNNPTLNRNIGKFQLSHIWDRVLFGTPNFKVANPKGNA